MKIKTYSFGLYGNYEYTLLQQDCFPHQLEVQHSA